MPLRHGTRARARDERAVMMCDTCSRFVWDLLLQVHALVIYIQYIYIYIYIYFFFKYFDGARCVFTEEGV